MSEPVTDSTEKVFEYKITESDVEELRAEGVPEEEIPAVGTTRRYIRARHIAPRREHEIKISIYLNGEILDFLRKRSDESLEKQINAELRKIMENETKKKENLREELLNDENFLRELREKLKAA
jgi:hypothetical protein